MRCLILFFLLFATITTQAQYRLQGRVTNSRLEPLAFVSVQVKELQRGTATKEDGSFELMLEEGRYHLVVSMIGYTTQTIAIAVTANTTHNILLEESAASLNEVVIRGTRKDMAEEIVRNVIRNKEQINSAAGAYSCTMYIKATQQDSATGKAATSKKDSAKQKGPKGDPEMQRMAMAEIVLRLDKDEAGHTKEERTGVKRAGSIESLFYLSATEGDFNFYNNLVKVPALSPTPFLSPISYSGLLAYKFKTVSITNRGGYKIYTISVRPRQLSNATVSGELVISDSGWVVEKTAFQFPKYHMPEYESFEVEQQFGLVDGKAWMLQLQQFRYGAKSKRSKLSGQTLVTYQGYALNKLFDKKHFGVEVSATTEAAYERDSSFWQKARTVPLTQKEIRFIQYRDSVYRATHTKAYLDSIDRITNKVTWKKVAFTGQTLYNREKERTWNLPPLVSLYQPFAFGGSRINATLSYAKTYPSRKNLYFFNNISYGLRNKDVNGSVRLTRLYNPFNRGYYTVSAGRDFQFIYPGDAWINLLKRSNVYHNNYFSVAHELELINGLYLYSSGEVALRRSVSNYRTGNLIDKSPLADELGDNEAIAFEPYNAVYGKLRLSYTPHQQYIREPKEKIILGSKWPTFYAAWRGGIPGVLRSEVQFHYLELGMEQQINLGLLGISRYNIKMGGFIDRSNLRLIDYAFQRRGDPLLFLNPDEAFQALDSTFPLFKRFYQGHFVHEFNGAFINKVPLLKKLNLREVGGAGFLLAPERNLRYAEVFGGVERVFKWPFNPLTKFKLGVYVVGSVANQFRNPVQLKIGITSWDARRNRWY